jgi:magnesium chelatase subunit D
VRTLKPRTRSTAVFAVDASGSAALHRLNEAKGAVESLLAQCYVRRDQVALISFRGAGAEVLLPPTRSLARVRRELSALPGGGGTPLASGIALAEPMGAELRRRGDAPLLVLLTDGRANVSRDGVGGRARAEQEAFAAATAVGQRGLPILLVDIAPLPQERARLLARAMNAEYLPLPAAGAERLASAVQARLPSLQQARRG